jgi:protein TonB
MTAAVARPPLFRHLVASNPEHEKGSFAATASSVTLHAAIVVAAVILTARVQAPPETPKPTEIVPIEQYVDPGPPRPTPRNGGTVSGPPAPAPAIVDFPMPNVVPNVIPPRGSMENLMNALENMMRAQPSAPSTSAAGTGTGENPGDFVPLTVKPELLNRAEVARAMTRLYPDMLVQAGIGGTVLVWLHLDENGKVVETRVKSGSGHSALDDAALKVAQTARFSPAYNRDQRVRVWVELPVVFGSR